MSLHILSFTKIIYYIAETDKYRKQMEKEAKLFVRYFTNYRTRKS